MQSVASYQLESCWWLTGIIAEHRKARSRTRVIQLFKKDTPSPASTKCFSVFVFLIYLVFQLATQKLAF